MSARMAGDAPVAPAGKRPLIYAGIGSRDTPPQILQVMTPLAEKMDGLGWRLRSGGAAGADAAFEAGVSDPRHRAIYLPQSSFNGRAAGTGGYINASRLPTWQQALATVSQYHPHPGALSSFAVNLMARNAYQVLGPQLNQPARMIVAWAPGGYEEAAPPPGWREGGTGQALRIARAWNAENPDQRIEIRNLANPQRLAGALRYLGLS